MLQLHNGQEALKNVILRRGGGSSQKYETMLFRDYANYLLNRDLM